MLLSNIAVPTINPPPVTIVSKVTAVTVSKKSAEFLTPGITRCFNADKPLTAPVPTLVTLSGKINVSTVALEPNALAPTDTTGLSL